MRSKSRSPSKKLLIRTLGSNEISSIVGTDFTNADWTCLIVGVGTGDFGLGVGLIEGLGVGVSVTSGSTGITTAVVGVGVGFLVGVGVAVAGTPVGGTAVGGTEVGGIAVGAEVGVGQFCKRIQSGVGVGVRVGIGNMLAADALPTVLSTKPIKKNINIQTGINNLFFI